MRTTNEFPEDKSKHDPEVRNHLFLLRFSHRLSSLLCIFCGEVKVPFGEAACPDCKQAQKQKRIAEAGYDYYEDLGW